MRRITVLIAMIFAVYLCSYIVLRCFVKPATNLAFFVYPGPVLVNSCCYYGFWPLYKVDRFVNGRKHNFDRTLFVIPEGDAGV